MTNSPATTNFKTNSLHDGMRPQAANPTTPDFSAIKSKQHAAWSSGDYARIGVTLQIVGENLAEALDLTPGARVLDVAAGNGNATLAFARRGSAVTSTDYVESLLDRGRARAEADGLNVSYRVADAERLPFEDGSFDAVVSTFGIMFAPNQAQAASEMVRVCRAGGRIGMANWTPEGYIGEMFKTLGRHVPPPAGIASPALWGSPSWLERTFGSSAVALSIEMRSFVFRFPSPENFVDIFRTYYGPVHKAYAALAPDKQAVLTEDLLALIARHNTSKDGSMRVPAEYAEVIIVTA